MLLPASRFILCGVLGVAACGCAGPITSRLGHRDAPVSRLAELHDELEEPASHRVLGALPWRAKEKASESLTHSDEHADRATTVAAHSSSSLGESSAADRRLTIARQLEQRGELADAEKLYRAVLRDDPQHALTHHRLGVLLAKQQDLANAEHHLRLALEYGSPSVELLNNLGYCCYLRGRYEAAEVYLRQALEVDPDHVTARSNLALVERQRKALAARDESQSSPTKTSSTTEASPAAIQAPAEPEPRAEQTVAATTATLATRPQAKPPAPAVKSTLSETPPSREAAPMETEPTLESEEEATAELAQPQPASSEPEPQAEEEPLQVTVAAEPPKATPASSSQGLAWVEDEASAQSESSPPAAASVVEPVAVETAADVPTAKPIATAAAETRAAFPATASSEAPVVRLVEAPIDELAEASAASQPAVSPVSQAKSEPDSITDAKSPSSLAKDVRIDVPRTAVDEVKSPPVSEANAVETLAPEYREAETDEPVAPVIHGRMAEEVKLHAAEAERRTPSMRSTPRRRSLLPPLTAILDRDEEEAAPYETPAQPSHSTASSSFDKSEFTPYVPPPHVVQQSLRSEMDSGLITEAHPRPAPEPQPAPRARRRALFDSLPSLNPFRWGEANETSAD